jgi:hypothetical protein
MPARTRPEARTLMIPVHGVRFCVSYTGIMKQAACWAARQALEYAALRCFSSNGP